ncbi:MAG: DUF86 domain-containing protein [Lewinellaceae bacterium]|nr:DUF86 domain-containing protein [Lewinellaceae bacterium]MBP6812780.1 DUF86 domain-containing protein [Saprospiraceae bacterium]
MHNDIILESLEIIAEALELVAKRFGEIDNPEEFILSDYNLTLIDAISMRLQVIGEKAKKIEKHSPGFWDSYGVDAQPIIRFRDFISHHYEDVEYEIILDACKNNLPDFSRKVNALLRPG